MRYETTDGKTLVRIDIENLNPIEKPHDPVPHLILAVGDKANGVDAVKQILGAMGKAQWAQINTIEWSVPKKDEDPKDHTPVVLNFDVTESGTDRYIGRFENVGGKYPNCDAVIPKHRINAAKTISFSHDRFEKVAKVSKWLAGGYEGRLIEWEFCNSSAPALGRMCGMLPVKRGEETSAKFFAIFIMMPVKTASDTNSKHWPEAWAEWNDPFPAEYVHESVRTLVGDLFNNLSPKVKDTFRDRMDAMTRAIRQNNNEA